MTTVSILPVPVSPGEWTYRAIAKDRQSDGRTAGEALDGITSQLAENESGTLVVVQHRRPDDLFTVEQQQRLEALMACWRTARDKGAELPPAEQAELDALVEAEVVAAGQRARRLASELGT